MSDTLNYDVNHLLYEITSTLSGTQYNLPELWEQECAVRVDYDPPPFGPDQLTQLADRAEADAHKIIRSVEMLRDAAEKVKSIQ